MILCKRRSVLAEAVWGAIAASIAVDCRGRGTIAQQLISCC
ncbi:hypothetical protein [Baaleninema simplex]|nr:hypothetical protein [Baaleninema simplex]